MGLISCAPLRPTGYSTATHGGFCTTSELDVISHWAEALPTKQNPGTQALNAGVQAEAVGLGGHRGLGNGHNAPAQKLFPN